MSFTRSIVGQFLRKTILRNQTRNFSDSANVSKITMPRLQGKSAIVTASTDGIGLAIAERLGKDGANVVISSRKQANVDKALSFLREKGCSVSGIVCHVGKREDREKLIKHALEKNGAIDILISNAAANPAMCQVLDTPEDAWDKIFDTNVKCAYLLSQEVLPYMKDRGSGSIIYISSIGGFQPFQLLGAYSVSKTALLGLTKAAAAQCAVDGIRVNCVAPGIVKTKFSNPLWSSENAKERILEMVPAGRIAEPHDISGLVAFLCTDEASYITGENFVVAGGMQSRL